MGYALDISSSVRCSVIFETDHPVVTLLLMIYQEKPGIAITHPRFGQWYLLCSFRLMSILKLDRCKMYDRYLPVVILSCVPFSSQVIAQRPSSIFKWPGTDDGMWVSSMLIATSIAKAYSFIQPLSNRELVINCTESCF